MQRPQGFNRESRTPQIQMSDGELRVGAQLWAALLTHSWNVLENFFGIYE